MVLICDFLEDVVCPTHVIIVGAEFVELLGTGLALEEPVSVAEVHGAHVPPRVGHDGEGFTTNSADGAPGAQVQPGQGIV